jgi:L-asparaginase
MKNLTENEKIVLVVFTVCALMSLVMCMYLSVNTRVKNKKVLNNRIYIIHAGGTVENTFDQNYITNRDIIGQFEVNVYDITVDSTNITPADWNRIATDLHSVYDMYDAFIIIVGKNTMTYTGAVLSFMLENLGKPVLLTDGELVNTLILASSTRIPEVMISSQGKLIRATRAVQYSDNAFTSPNFPALEEYNCLSPPLGEFSVKQIHPNVKISLVKVFPGMEHKQLLGLLNDQELRGIVVELYVDGNMPFNKKILGILKALINKGVIVVGVSENGQKQRMNIDLNMSSIGVISAHNMTVSSAFAKLYFLLSNVPDIKVIPELIQHSLRGELTILGEDTVGVVEHESQIPVQHNKTKAVQEIKEQNALDYGELI